MRLHVVFLILWSLLGLCRLADTAHWIGQYRLVTTLEAALKEPTPLNVADEKAMRSIGEQKSQALDRTFQGAFETALLIGVLACFFKCRQSSVAAPVKTESPRTS